MDLSRFQAHRQLDFDTRVTNRGGVSTLLIPAILTEKLDTRLQAYGISLSAYTRELLLTYRAQLLHPDLGVHHSCRRLYQLPGLNLIRRNFRPDPEVWVELGIFAAYMGVSRCYFFTYLLMLDLHGHESGEEGAPTDRVEVYDLFHPEYMEYRERITDNHRIKREILHVPKHELDLPLHLIPYPYPENFLRERVKRKYGIWIK